MPSLPINDNRRPELNERQNNVQYDFNLIPPLPMFRKLKNFPNFKWLIRVAKIALQLQRNTTEFTKQRNSNIAGLTDIFQNNQQIINDNDNDAEKSGDQKTNEVKPIVSGMLRALQVNRINGPGDKLEEYNDIFTTIPLPKIFNNFFEDFLDNDQEFAWMRYYCWQSL